MNDFWIILTGSLVAVSCGLLGCYLILRKMAMVGDAISHAVLPGLFVAYFFAGSRAAIPMLIGAASFGLLCTFLIEFFSKRAKMQTDAAIGLAFTFLFAVGVILISHFAGQVELDQDCILYGEISYVPLDIWLDADGNSRGPIAVWSMGIVFISILLLIGIGYKGLYITTFDPAFAAAIGISNVFWHYLLMASVSITTVVAFDSVGAILVVAFLIGPAATAYLLTDNFNVMLLLSAVIGILATILGYYAAIWIDGSIAGAMAAMIGVLFTIALLFSPSQGLLTGNLRHKEALDSGLEYKLKKSS